MVVANFMACQGCMGKLGEGRGGQLHQKLSKNQFLGNRMKISTKNWHPWGKRKGWGEGARPPTLLSAWFAWGWVCCGGGCLLCWGVTLLLGPSSYGPARLLEGGNAFIHLCKFAFMEIIGENMSLRCQRDWCQCKIQGSGACKCTVSRRFCCFKVLGSLRSDTCRTTGRLWNYFQPWMTVIASVAPGGGARSISPECLKAPVFENDGKWGQGPCNHSCLVPQSTHKEVGTGYPGYLTPCTRANLWILW